MGGEVTCADISSSSVGWLSFPSSTVPFGLDKLGILANAKKKQWFEDHLLLNAHVVPNITNFLVLFSPASLIVSMWHYTYKDKKKGYCQKKSGVIELYVAK